MQNYRIYFTEETRDSVMEVVKNFSNDILIDNVTDDSVGITIESDDAENIYRKLIDSIKDKLHVPEPRIKS